MKNIFNKSLVVIGLGIILCMSSCDERPKGNTIEGDTYATCLKTLTIKGSSHEFIIYRPIGGDCGVMGMSHWPECKFCTK